jgi:hypothetical protein
MRTEDAAAVAVAVAAEIERAKAALVAGATAASRHATHNALTSLRLF